MVAESDAQTLPDPISLPRFEDRLWVELAQLHAEGASSRRGGGLSRGRYLAMAAAVLAVVGTVGAGVVLTDRSGGSSDDDVRLTPAEDPGGDEGPDGGEEPDGATPRTTGSTLPPPPPMPESVVFQEQVNANGSVSQTWTDEATDLFRSVELDPDGTVISETSWTGLEQNEDGTVTVSQRSVDHVNRTYSETEWTPPVPVEEWPLASEVDGASNYQGLLAGQAVDEGLEEVDGVELRRLVDALGNELCGTAPSSERICVSEAAAEPYEDWQHICAGGSVIVRDEDGAEPGSEATTTTVAMREPGEPPPRAGGLVEVEEVLDPQDCVLLGDMENVGAEPEPDLGITWVDPETYRSVKRIGYPGSDAEYTMTFEHLERTPDNLALLEVVFPEGYTPA